MKSLELKLPPALLFLLCGALAWAVAEAAPAAWRLPDGAGKTLARGLAIIAAGFGVAAVLQFRRNGTTANPLDPPAASRLVTGGVFRWSRNPMYLALLLLLLAWAARLGQPLAVVGAALFAAWITRFQIVPEERALENRFGEEFRRYRERVRRWL